jgi:hypothetical protein
VFALSQQQVIFKGDDLAATFRWKRHLDYLETRGIVSTAGVIGNSLPPMSEIQLNYLRQLDLVEFWNHGWDHGAATKEGEFIDPPPDDVETKADTAEFWNTPPEQQMEHMRLCHEAVQTYLGITMHGFGAPENKHDCNTVPAFLACGYDHWYFPKYSMLGCRPEGVKTLARGGGEIESSPGVPSLARLMSSYDPDRPLIILQVHPQNWDDAMFGEFQQCIEFLLDQGVEFTTPGLLEAPDPPQVPATSGGGLAVAVGTIAVLYRQWPPRRRIKDLPRLRGVLPISWHTRRILEGGPQPVCH